MTLPFSIRAFQPDEWQKLKAIRLEALQKESGKFGASFAKDNARTDDEWRDWIAGGQSGFFALLHEDDIVGMTGVRLKTPDTASFIASYIRAEYRGHGASALFYQARIDWARAHGAKRAITGHRKSNAPSKAANQKFGFVYLETTENVSWPDGTVEDHIVYELEL